jgi:hypothetical protein
VVHARELDGRVLTFLVSGKLWRNSLVMQDEETGTLWSHITGEALAGELAGASLELVPAVQTTWAAWRAAHPETRVLRKSAEIKGSRYAAYFADPARTGIFRSNWLQGRLPGKELVYGIRSGVHAAAVTAAALAADEPRHVQLGDETITIQRDDDGGVRAWKHTEGSTPVPHDVLPVYWFAWSSFFPNTEVVE